MGKGYLLGLGFELVNSSHKRTLPNLFLRCNCRERYRGEFERFRCYYKKKKED